ELGPELERFAPRINPQQRTPVLLAAADAFRAAGDAGNELRLLSSVPTPYLGGEHLQRYFELLLSWDPQQMVQMASNWTPLGQQAADFVIANGDAALAHAVVSARGKFRPAVWTKSYTALAGVYFGEAMPEIKTAFLGALGDQTVGERLRKQ